MYQNLDLGEIPRQIVEQDISVFLRQKLGRLSLQYELLNWPSEDNIRSLVQKADCLFIYAATACRFTDWNPEDRFSDILKADSANGSDTAQLDEMYMQVLNCATDSGKLWGLSSLRLTNYLSPLWLSYFLCLSNR